MADSASDNDRRGEDRLAPSYGADFPARLRLLCVARVEPSWVSLALQLDALGCFEPEFRWVPDRREALSLLRDDSFDCLVIAGAAPTLHGEDGPLSVLKGVRTSGGDDPTVVIVSSADDSLWAEALALDADLLVTPHGWESRALVPAIRRAIERVRVVRDNHRLATADRRRLTRERAEAETLLNQQRQIIEELSLRARSEDSSLRHDHTSPPTSPPLAVDLPPQLDDYYQELLRTYVIMGSGNLGTEIAKLAELLCVTGLRPRQVLELHLLRVERLVRGLGNRSTRHVMARADLLALELMIHLGECYQRKASGESIAPAGWTQAPHFKAA
jgi:hypothetical protein